MGAAYSVNPKTVYLPSIEPTLQSSLKGQVIAITGCTTGTGYSTALWAAKHGAHVLLLNRPSQRATDAENSIRAEIIASPNAGKVETIPCDLMDFQSVREAAKQVSDVVTKHHDGSLNTLILNAGIMATPDQATKDGYDTQMQTNVISHFLLTKLTYPLLEKAATGNGNADEARIISMTSSARYGPPLDSKYLGKNGGNLGGDKQGRGLFSGPRWDRYHQSKLGNCVFTYALHDKLQKKGSNVKSLLAHPGLAATNLQATTHSTGGMPLIFGPIYYFVAQSQEDGAAPMIKCMAGKSSEVQSGDFYGPIKAVGMYGPPEKISPEANCTDPISKDMLWNQCEAAIGEQFVI